ncbi:MAG: hypothetical protein IJ088_04970 [Clostridia bacterium]|nr:hypothetical protein [Clostridia bacterium]
MGIVNQNERDMPVPSFAYTSRLLAYIITVDTDGVRHRRTIGRLTDTTENEERMVPNYLFKEHYPLLCRRNGLDAIVTPYYKRIGLYALTRAAALKTGLDAELKEAFGDEQADSILDYVMFSLMTENDVTETFEEIMWSNVLFAGRCCTDAWYADFFREKMSEEAIRAFRVQRVRRMAGNGLRKVWLCIDGLAEDGARRSVLETSGFPEVPDPNAKEIGCLYAVDTENQDRLVTYEAYNGCVPDIQTLRRMEAFLSDFGIEIEGIFLPRGFATERVFETVEQLGWKYVLLLPEEAYGHTQMLEGYGETIRWRLEYILGRRAIFGISDHRQLFTSETRCGKVCLIFDPMMAVDQSTRLMREMEGETRKLEEAIEKDEPVAICPECQPYLSIEGEGKDRKVVMGREVMSRRMKANGFFTLAISEEVTPNLTAQLFKDRDDIETELRILRARMGGVSGGVPGTEGIYGRLAVSFISGIIRAEIMDKLEMANTETDIETDTDTDNGTELFFWDLERIDIIRMSNGEYKTSGFFTKVQKKLFELYGLKLKDIVRLGKENDERLELSAGNLGDGQVILKNSREKEPKTAKREKAAPKEKESLQGVTPQKPEGKAGRPKGIKDTKPRKPRSDKGKKRGAYRKKTT